MKKTLISILIISLVLQMFSFSFANKFLEVDVVDLIDTFDGSTGSYKVVNLMVNGDDVFSDLPSILYVLNGNTRTLVPISFIAKKIGADIAWNEERREVTMNHEGKEIILKIDSNIALVDGVEMELPNGIPAKQMIYEGTYRTMVPVNFVTQHLGYEIFWIDETRTVAINRPEQTLSQVRYSSEGAYPELRFKVSDEVSMTSYSVDGQSVGESNSITLEFHNTKLALNHSLDYGRLIINDMMQEVYDIKFEETTTGSKNIKATIGLGYFRNGDVHYDAETGEMVVQLINSVNYVDVEEVNQVKAVVIDSSEVPAYNVTKLGNRVMIDIIHSKLAEFDNTIAVNDDGSKTIVVNDSGIKTIDYKQFDNETTYDAGTRYSRVTVNLEAGLTSDHVYVDNVGTKVYVYVKESALGTYSYSRNLDSASSLFGLKFLSAEKYPVTYDATSRQLSLQVPKSNVNLLAGNNAMDDGVIDKISVIENDSVYDITITLAENTNYMTTTTANKAFRISFANEILKNSDYKDRLIVIDAGHGGHDPGATNNGYLEKDIALEASLILKRKLENAGFKVYLTRERDNYVKLYDRAGIANQLNADMFISVHINAAQNSKAKGIEVLYDPDPARNNYALAKEIQSELIRGTGATDRGVVSRPDLVVTRETEMNAVLVELGFLSNTDDQQRLLTTAYLENCAEAILKGVKDFMD